jgi:hypothetical protein
MSREEIAEILHLSVNAVKNIEFMALRKVKEKFLKIDSEENYIKILSNSREQDPYESYLDYNYDL